jgi:YegS/Rv2252/BmrU family lipid kinase
LTRRVHVIANPNAAGGRAQRVLPALERLLTSEGIEYSLERTRAPGHARHIALAARNTPSVPILIVGGDGTVHEVAAGLLAGRTGPGTATEGPAVAILPVGTGNDFYRMVRAPGGVEGAVRTVKQGVPRAFDVGVATWDGKSAPFVNLLGVGIDVEVLRRRASFRALRGLPQYLAALGSALARYRPIGLHVSYLASDGTRGEVQGETLLSAVTVGPSVGGGFFLSPGARPDDGLLDLFVAERLGLLRVIRYLPGVLKGTLAEGPGIHRRQVSRIELRRQDGGPFAFEIDGELMDDGTRHIEVLVRPGGLRILELPNGSGS